MRTQLVLMNKSMHGGGIDILLLTRRDLTSRKQKTKKNECEKCLLFGCFSHWASHFQQHYRFLNYKIEKIN